MLIQKTHNNPKSMKLSATKRGVRAEVGRKQTMAGFRCSLIKVAVIQTILGARFFHLLNKNKMTQNVQTSLHPMQPKPINKWHYASESEELLLR